MNRNRHRAAARQRPEAPRVLTGEGAAAPGGASALFAAAKAHHQSGGLTQAEALYRQALERDPNHTESYHFLGLLAHQIGRSDIAVAMIAKAIALNGRDPALHNNLGNILRAQGKSDEAAASYRLALALSPNYADALGNLGNVLKDQGKLAEAIAHYRRALALKPDFVDAHNNLGNALKNQGKLEDAVACYRRALALRPNFADAHNNLGNALKDQGRLEEAAQSYLRALALRPQFPDAYNNLGVALNDQGKRDEAEASYRQAFSIDPNFAPAHYNLGNLLKERGRLDEAAMAYGRALAARPNLADAHNNLGNALKDLGRAAEAVECFRRALALKPDFAEAHNNLGAALVDLGNPDEAATALRRAIALRPNLAGAFGNLGNADKDVGRLDEALASYEQALRLNPHSAETHSNLLMTRHYLPCVSSAEHLAAARRFGRDFEGSAPARTFSNDRTETRRLRIGYVSGDFRQHPVGYFLARVLEARDPAAVEIFCYANQVKTDDMTGRLRRAADHWRRIFGLSDTETAALVSQDAIDILVDLSGHTAKNRLPLFVLRPAPVQVSWLGYFGTTGLDSMDYLVMDRWAAPPGEEQWFAEAVARLPHGRFCYAPPDYAPDVVDPPALAKGYVTFGSFNNVAKIGPEVVNLWAAVLQATPQSRFIIKWKSLDEADARCRLAEAFVATGVDPERLELRGFSPHAEMLAQYREIGIALDPFPFGGGLTSC